MSGRRVSWVQAGSGVRSRLGAGCTRCPAEALSRALQQQQQRVVVLLWQRRALCAAVADVAAH